LRTELADLRAENRAERDLLRTERCEQLVDLGTLARTAEHRDRAGTVESGSPTPEG